MNEWEEKIWGKTRCIYASEFVSQHHLVLKVNTFCSFHYHERRANDFHVLSGVVRVVYVIGYRLFYQDIKKDKFFKVPSMVPHQFQVLEAGDMVERYFPDRGGQIRLDDIVRLTPGGTSESNISDRKIGIHFADGHSWNEENGCRLQLCSA